MAASACPPTRPPSRPPTNSQCRFTRLRASPHVAVGQTTTIVQVPFPHPRDSNLSSETMSTALSMHSPHSHGHGHGTGAFATSLQLSPAFRSLHAAALRQRQLEFERLRELARSDEFSDDESDGDENDEPEEDDDEEENDKVQDGEDNDDDDDDVVAAEALATHAAPTRLSPRYDASDSDIDADETVLLPFIRPAVTGMAATRAPHQAMSPRVDEWTIVDKSPTCEALVFDNIRVSESWFSRH